MQGQKQNQNKLSFPAWKKNRKLILGLTGGFGSGKTTVARIFKSYGARIIDADKLAHACIVRGSKCYQKIIDTFGKNILKKNGIIDRRKLGEIVFRDTNSLLRLNRIIHPEVIRAIEKTIKNSKSKIIVLDAPLLVEAGLRRIVDKLIVVKINREKQMQRIQSRTCLSKADILRRIRRQLALRSKISLADFVIDNSGTIKKTKEQVEQIRRLLWKS